MRLVVLAMLIVSHFCGLAQNLESIGKANPVKLSGGFNATAIGYKAIGLVARRDPFNYFLTGNLNIEVYGISAPLTFSYSNQNASFRQPFNQFSIAPTYKWVKTYFGYHNLTYSSYSLVGHIFSGAAIELTPPNKFRLSAMYGRLSRAVEEDTILNTLPSFRRMGFAVKVGYGDNQNGVEVVMFRAQDELNSLKTVPVKSQLFPSENLVLSVIGKKKLGQHIAFIGELATSAITRDTRTEKINLEKPSIFSYAGGLFTTRASSEYYNAIKSSLAYTGNLINVQLNYERVDPGYQSLGAYFFNNDIENITVSTSVRLLKNKIDLAANVGTQRNDLNNTKVSGTHRTISAFNFNFNPNQKWNVNGSYSNFTTFTKVRPRFDPFFKNNLDTLNFYQINQNATGSVAYNFGTKEIKQGIFFNGNYQVVNETPQANAPSTNSKFYTGNLAYRYTKAAANLSVTAAINCNKGEVANRVTLSLGPNLSITKAFMEKRLRCTLTTTYNQLFQNDVIQNNVFNLRVNGSYAVQKKHIFSANLVSLTKLAVDDTKPDFNEFTATINYGYSF